MVSSKNCSDQPTAFSKASAICALVSARTPWTPHQLLSVQTRASTTSVLWPAIRAGRQSLDKHHSALSISPKRALKAATASSRCDTDSPPKSDPISALARHRHQLRTIGDGRQERTRLTAPRQRELVPRPRRGDVQQGSLAKQGVGGGLFSVLLIPMQTRNCRVLYAEEQHLGELGPLRAVHGHRHRLAWPNVLTVDRADRDPALGQASD